MTTERAYTLVLGEITTALFSCPDCGAVVWHAGRSAHNDLHRQIDNLTVATLRQSELLDDAAVQLDEHAAQIAHIQGQTGDLESSVYRLTDTVQDVGYRVDDAQRAAERAADAASSAGRGW